jgi:CheY-like chemotaxis protein
VRRLLLVDDEPDILETVVQLLEAKMPDVVVTPVANGLAALAVMERERFDAVLTDYKMPGLDGAALVQRIRARWPGLPVLMFTAFMDAGTLAQVHAKVPDLKIIPKPLDVDFLLEQIGLALPV